MFTYAPMLLCGKPTPGLHLTQKHLCSPLSPCFYVVNLHRGGIQTQKTPMLPYVSQCFYVVNLHRGCVHTQKTPMFPYAPMLLCG